MQGRRLDDFLEALQRHNPARLNATLPTFFEVARTLGLYLDLDSWAQLREGLLLNKRLLESAREDCHFALANQAWTDHEQALVLQQLTVLQKDFATLRLQCFWLYLNFPVALQGATFWNRRHLDVMTKSSRVQFPLSPICESFVLLRHQLSHHSLTDALNSYFEQAGVPHFRLLHLPPLWDRQQRLQQFEHEGLIPLDFRPQLSRRSQL